VTSSLARLTCFRTSCTVFGRRISFLLGASSARSSGNIKSQVLKGLTYSPLTQSIDPASSSTSGGSGDGAMVYSISKWISDCKRQDTQSKVQLLNDDRPLGNPEVTVSFSSPSSLCSSQSLVGLSCLSQCRLLCSPITHSVVRECHQKDRLH
jgi:hypothetical protein